MRFVILLLVAAACGFGQTKLLRFPDVHGDRVVFTYAGDLWTAPVAGGAAARLTAHPGLELFAKYSPDGKWIAFTGQYDGDEQVYVIPSSGGVPKQLTWYPAKGPLPARWGYDNQVYEWTPDGKSILFRSLRDSWTTAESRLYTVPAEGGAAKALPMPKSGAGDYSPDGQKVVYSPLFRDFRTWKRYQGGWQQDLFVFDLKTAALEPVAHSPRTEREPMWMGGRIYFNSDRTGTFNLYEYDPGSKKVKALTASAKWDVRWPSRGDQGRIVYESDGELNVVDVKSGQAKKISINVPSDGLASRPSLLNVGGQVAAYDLSPKGERALFVARGDVFTAPIEKGVARNLTKSSNAHDKAPAWSPDGRRIVMISDRTGEEELWVVNQDGSGPAEQLTRGGKTMRYRPVWSPDSKRVAFSDRDGKAYVVTLSDKSVVEVAQEKRGFLMDYVWSPDGAYLAFSLTDMHNFRSIWIWSAAEGKARRVTGEMFNESGPAWDPEGQYLYYLSDREFAPLISGAEFNYATARSTSIYALALRKDGKNPFAPESDEVKIAEEKKAEEKKADGAKVEVRIDFDGLEQRVVRVPVAPGNYDNLMAVKGHLLYSRSGNPYYGRGPDAPDAIMILALKERKETVLVEGAAGYAISDDGQKMLVGQGNAYALYDVKPGGASSKKAVSTAGLVVDRVPSQEWAQIFNEVWRRYRDFFYAKNMHGYDWEALRQQYAPMLEYVTHRSDLNYIIGEMISELNAGHAYIDGGDWERPERPKVALPGARFELDEAAGRYKIAKIFAGQNEEPVYRSPLTEVGVNVKAGEYVLAIDGDELKANVDPYRLLRGKAGKAVRLTVNTTAAMEGAREVVIQPVDNENNLVYLAMVDAARARVDQATGGRVGYLHVPNMGADGIREFIKYFYGQTRREGLVVDMRGNGGGNVSRMLIERLRRQVLALTYPRGIDDPTTYPDNVMMGPMVCLLNENSASDGDIFPAMFRESKLGLLIGKRSWGGVVGISNRGTLVDGGVVNVPEFGFANAKGEWIIEGVGVEPDIVVENDPKSVMEGRDPQLERGIEEVLKAMKLAGKRLPGRPADPMKTK
ncbi:MAG: PD40 domain-containing protein [Bryobacterales bacterium]|nr:PD40 domain-containing protein [Bryobacterales bacterium]